MAAHFIHKQFSQIVFGGFLVATAFTFLNLWKPKYSTFYSMSKIKRLWFNVYQSIEIQLMKKFSDRNEYKIF